MNKENNVWKYIKLVRHCKFPACERQEAACLFVSEYMKAPWRWGPGARSEWNVSPFIFYRTQVSHLSSHWGTWTDRGCKKRNWRMKIFSLTKKRFLKNWQKSDAVVWQEVKSLPGVDSVNVEEKIIISFLGLSFLFLAFLKDYRLNQGLFGKNVKS